MIRYAPAGLAALGLLMPAAAQDAGQGRQESIVVTAQMIDGGDLQSAPAIYRRIPADFVLVEVIFQSGTRASAERREELEACFDRVVAAAARAEGFELSGGDIGESSAPIDSVMFGDVYSGDYNEQSSFRLTLSVDTRANESFDQLMARAKTFLESIDLEGRAESFLGSEQFLGARNMGAHRQGLLSDIADEVARLRDPMGASHVRVSGLESRVVTQPSGPLELEIFVPYTMVADWGEMD